MYVADKDNDRIQKFDSNGTFVTMWSTKGTGDSQFDSPSGIAVDLFGQVYVADLGNDCIQVFSPSTN